ncbi:DUF3987 domain-containing protein, partial [Vineibacter terrae]|uniref:DUF3987 domain-containing protein n=1 Tax=Vineibacter terrae TaxID=2586908 RepID=UPI002E34439D
VPPPPPRRCLLVADPRIAALAEALPASSSGVLLSCDDGDAWLAGLRDDARRNGNLPFWRSAWSATPCVVNRKAASPVVLAQPAVSILGTLRTDAIVPALARCDDGAVAQLLFAWPNRPGFQALAGAPAVARADALRVLARLRDMPGAVREVALAPDAVAAFDRFRRAHHAQAGAQQGLAAAWWGKGTGIVLRLAGVLAFLDWAARPPRTAEPAHVPAWAIEAAADLWQGYLWPHAQAVLRTGGNTDQRRAGQVLQWLARQGADEVSGTALRVAALGRACNAAQTARITQSLVRAGWLRPVVADARHAGRKPARWAVHPDLRDGHDA